MSGAFPHAKELAVKLTLELRDIVENDDYEVLAIGGYDGDPKGFGVYRRGGGTHIVSIRFGAFSPSAVLLRVFFDHLRAERQTLAQFSHR